MHASRGKQSVHDVSGQFQKETDIAEAALRRLQQLSAGTNKTLHNLEQPVGASSGLQHCIPLFLHATQIVAAGLQATDT